MAIATIEDNRDYMLGKYEQILATLRFLIDDSYSFIGSTELALMKKVLGMNPQGFPDEPPHAPAPEQDDDQEDC